MLVPPGCGQRRREIGVRGRHGAVGLEVAVGVHVSQSHPNTVNSDVVGRRTGEVQVQDLAAELASR